MPIVPIADIRDRVGKEIGVSSWLTMDQQRIDEFAESTEDRQFIHVDPQAAAQTPFGTTIAHGFLSLSMLSRMAAEVMLVPDSTKMAVNYGLDRVQALCDELGMSGTAHRRGTPDYSLSRDHGPGVPEYAEEKVFEKFYSLARPHGAKRSTGLGLSFAREIAQLHDGRVTLSNAPDGGALAVLTLPLAGPRTPLA